jgi:predicted membrane protein (TIGR00267 family)
MMRQNRPNRFILLLDELRLLLRVSRYSSIARRYFVTNGFDGALTMLGLMMGFRVSGETDLTIATGACLGAAVALGISGISSAYISEKAERQLELMKLEQAMLQEMDETAQGKAARLIPALIALVNGLSPLLLCLIIMLPLWLGERGIPLGAHPFDAAIGTAFVLIFVLGVFLGRISGRSWLGMGLRTLLIALATSFVIRLLVS